MERRRDWREGGGKEAKRKKYDERRKSERRVSSERKTERKEKP